MKDKILSIQSKLVYGYVGSNVAELAIQLHKFDVISFPTVLLSTHTGHQPVYGKAIDKGFFDELVKGIENLNIIESTSCIITGYIGTEDILQSASAFVQKIKKQYPEKPYICDPVMGDYDQGLYVPEKVAQNLMESLVPYSDIITPNHFEIEYILQRKIRTLNDISENIAKLPLLKNKTVVITSCNLEDTPHNQIETVIFHNNKAERVLSPKINIETTGTGDLFTALLSSQLSTGKNITEAVSYASHIISQCLDYILQHNLKELNAACLVKFINNN